MDINETVKKFDEYFKIEPSEKYTREEITYFFLWQDFKAEIQRRRDLIEESISMAEGVEQFLIAAFDYVIRQMDEAEARL